MSKSILIALSLISLMSSVRADVSICDIDQDNPICVSGEQEDEGFTDSDVGCTDDCLDSETN